MSIVISAVVPVALDVDAAFQMYEEGAPLRVVAQAFGVSASLVCKRFERAGLPRRPTGPPATIHVRRAFEYYSDSHTLKETAAEFGVSIATLHHRFVLAGYQCRGSNDLRRRSGA